MPPCPTASPTASAGVNGLDRLERLTNGFGAALWPDRRDREWAAQIDAFEREGFDFDAHILPGTQAFFTAHIRRMQTDATWQPLRSLKHPGVRERIAEMLTPSTAQRTARRRARRTTSVDDGGAAAIPHQETRHVPH